MDIFLARQPIFDRYQKVYGYELLHRTSDLEYFDEPDGDKASMSIIRNTLLLIGPEKIARGKRAFINFTRNLLMNGTAFFLPKSIAVIEILEDIEVDRELLEACLRIKKNGYLLALDDFISATWQEFLTLPFADESKYELFAEVAELMQPRTKQFNQVVEWNYFFTDKFERNAKAFKKTFKREENRIALAAVAEAFTALEAFTAETIQNAIAAVEKNQELHEGQLNLPLRLAVTGTNAGGDIIKTLTLIGQERAIARIKATLADFNIA